MTGFLIGPEASIFSFLTEIMTRKADKTSTKDQQPMPKTDVKIKVLRKNEEVSFQKLLFIRS